MILSCRLSKSVVNSFAGLFVCRHGAVRDMAHSKEVSVIGQLNKDEWSGFADLMANLTEKYAAVLDIDNLPDKREENSLEETKVNLESEKTA